MAFSQHSLEKLQQIRTLHSDFLRDSASVSDYLKYLSMLQIQYSECHLAIVSALSSAIIFANVTDDLHHFGKCFSSLISSTDEVVRRSCLSLISLLSQKGQLEQVLKHFSPLFSSWNERAQEMMLSFAFSFVPKEANKFKVFLPFAETCRNSKDELLSSTATDFIIYLKAPQKETTNEPKAVMMLRSSINFSKIHENFPMDFIDDFVDDDDESDKIEPPKKVDIPERNFDEYDENAAPPPGRSLLMNSMELKIPNNDKNSPKRNSPIPSHSTEDISPKKKSSRNSVGDTQKSTHTESTMIPRSTKKQRNSEDLRPKSKASAFSNSIEDHEFQETENTSQHRTKTALPTKQRESSRSPKPSSPKPKPSSARSKNTSAPIPQPAESPKKKKAPPPPPISELTENLRSKDWEQQQKAVDLLMEQLNTDSAPLAPHCKDIWLNLLDSASSPRTMLANNALQLAEAFYAEFSKELCPQTSQWISSLLNMTCSSHQFIADGASAVLLSIADHSPRTRVFSSFMSGIKHKNSIARGKATQCMSIVLTQGNIDEKELKMLVQNVAPLIRDTRVETRDAAKKALKDLSKDERFAGIAKMSLSAQDYTELKKNVDI
ncbi:hypothetical protein TRFO_34202 [Tritrichomonas foetus]|uniref:TOG domain-containing protein n=1 Tax=Tritrichomonas foetus TaxID=1144522 RepID=A0A1J4JJK7_9EUKA|nr:hypothetical protein TRFO_34202 [Tritrichomonas foetus]|eukprot:OHS99350.1 hypothetical protein TRFO_34202 [Tritrichomonas foetus]